MIRIEALTENNFNEFSLDSYVRTQPVTRVYRRQNGEYRLVDLPYTEDWSPEKKRDVARELLSGDYTVWLALDGSTVAGFVSLEKRLRGSRLILENMHVSGQYRGQGLGRKLFDMARQTAREAGAEMLYISACSSEETIAFYRAMGAELTGSPIPEMAEAEPCDLQMTCPV